MRQKLLSIRWDWNLVHIVINDIEALTDRDWHLALIHSKLLIWLSKHTYEQTGIK
jgi:hypothetical protein